MGVSKFVYGGETKFDLTGDNVTPESLVVGHTAHGADGELVEGANPYVLQATDTEVQTQTDLISQIQTALQGKAAGGGSGKPEQEKTVEITENGTHEVVPDDGYALSKVTVNVNVSEPDPLELYQRVAYIEPAVEGTYPYIITDIYADDSTGVEVVASFPNMADRIPMGSREDSGTTRFYCVYPLSTSSCYYGFNIGSSISCSTKVNTVYRLQTNFMNSRQAIIYEEDGTRKAFASFTQTLSKHTVPISIFGYHSAASGAVTSKREYKLYSARISQGFEVIREYIPCYRKSDGVVGVFERFTGQFLTSEIEATFTTGLEIDW